MNVCACLRLVLFFAETNRRMVLDNLELRADAAVDYVEIEWEDDEAMDLVYTYRTTNDTLMCRVLDSRWTTRSGIRQCNLSLPWHTHRGGQGWLALNRSTLDIECPSDASRTYRMVQPNVWLRSGACRGDPNV